MTDDHLNSMFQRRERHVGRPLRPRPNATPSGAAIRPRTADAAPQTVAMAPETAVETPAVSPPVSIAHQPRRPTPAAQEPVGTRRNSVFLSKEQEQWIKAVRGRLMVAGTEVSSSEIVRLALDRLQRTALTDGDLYDAVVRARAGIRPRGPQLQAARAPAEP